MDDAGNCGVCHVAVVHVHTIIAYTCVGVGVVVVVVRVNVVVGGCVVAVGVAQQ